MTFLSNENKAMLWELINETGIFDTVVNMISKQKMIELFEELLLKINNNNLSLTEKNKHVLSEYISILNKVHTEPIQSKEDSIKHRENLFEERLRLKQEEFRQYIAKPPPAINFLEKEQDHKIEPFKFIDLTESIRNNSLLEVKEIKDVKENKKKVSFNDLNPLDMREEIKEIKEMLKKICNKLDI